MTRKLLLAFCLAATALPAAAQSSDPTLLGAGIRTRPDYDGSDSRKVDFIPVVRYYGEPWFARTTQGILEGGARTSFGNGLTGGAQIAYEQGPRDDGDGASVGFHLEWDTMAGPAPVTLLARLRHYLDTDHGSQFDLRGTAGIHRSGPAVAGVFAQLTFANAKNTGAYYGVRDSGLLYTDLGVLGSYDLSDRWMLVGSLHFRRLASGVHSSRFVQDRTGFYASAGAAYKF